MKLVDNKPKLSSNKDKLLDMKVTNCKDCLFGIFRDHVYHWTSRGYVHDDCCNVYGVKPNGVEDPTS